jgi:hypothetical protein
MEQNEDKLITVLNLIPDLIKGLVTLVLKNTILVFSSTGLLNP